MLVCGVFCLKHFSLKVLQGFKPPLPLTECRTNLWQLESVVPVTMRRPFACRLPFRKSPLRRVSTPLLITATWKTNQPVHSPNAKQSLDAALDFFVIGCSTRLLALSRNQRFLSSQDFRPQ